MPKYHDKRFPGESDDYRRKRDELLEAEIELRKQIEEVARQRRSMPLGGKIPKDYIFKEGSNDLSDTETVKETKFSELFGDGKQTLFIYSFMFAPGAERPCTSCNSILDGLNGQARHIKDKINFAVVAKVPIEQLRNWARKRGWNGLRLLSSYNNNYNTDYFAEAPNGNQLPAGNVFRKTDDGIYHFYSTELLYVPSEEGQDGRHVDMMWPMWNIFDMTPEGRGTGWYPKHEYQHEVV